jgi:predicted ATPase
VASEHGFLTWQAAAYMHLLAAMSQVGMLETAMGGLEDTIEEWTKAGAGLMVPYFLAQLAAAKLASGAASDACALLDEALDASVRTGEHLYGAEILRLRAQSRRAAGGDDAAVVADLEAAVRAAYGRNQRVFVLRALVDLAGVGGRSVTCGSSAVDLPLACSWWQGREGPPELAEAMRIAERAS